jgi:hypothetical protein
METWKSINNRLDSLNLKKMNYLSDNEYGIPTIRKQDININKFIPFGNKTYDGTAHFFLDDFKFERVWNTPKKYLNVLKQYEGVCSPDFSLYTDYPIALQIYNVYRNRALGKYWQRNGIKVIPTIGWSTPESYDFCFLGIEPRSTVVISSLGILRDKEAIELFIMGFDEMKEQIKPDHIHFYGDPVPDLEDEFIVHENYAKTSLRCLDGR